MGVRETVHVTQQDSVCMTSTTPVYNKLKNLELLQISFHEFIGSWTTIDGTFNVTML